MTRPADERMLDDEAWEREQDVISDYEQGARDGMYAAGMARLRADRLARQDREHTLVELLREIERYIRILSVQAVDGEIVEASRTGARLLADRIRAQIGDP